MTRMALTSLLGLILTCGLGCTDWGVTPLQQPAPAKNPQPAPAPARAPRPEPQVVQNPANSAPGGTLDSRGDATAAEAVRQYLADLDNVQQRKQPPSSAPAGDPAPTAQPVKRSDPPALDRGFGRPEPAPAAAPPTPIVVAVAPAATPAPTAPAATADGAAQANAPVTLENTAEEVPPAPADPRRPQVTAVSLVGNTEPTADAAVGAVAVNTPPAESAASVAGGLEGLISEAQAALAKTPSDARAQWRLSLLLMAAGRTAEAGEFSPGLTEQQRGLLARQVAVNAAVEDVLAGEPEQSNAAYVAANALRDALRHDAELELPVLALCSKVTTFGVYTELSENALQPYRANRAIIYCEVRNLATERDAGDSYRSLLATRLELFSADGQSLWTHEEQRIDDVARRPREDFFIAQLVTFPPTLAPGQYTLKATVTDLIGNKTNETTRAVTVGKQ